MIKYELLTIIKFKKMKTNLKKSSIFSLVLMLLGGCIYAQKTSIDSTKTTESKAGKTTNMMLNASADNGPRVVNIGLPASVGGTTILENGLPVVYDYMGQMPTTVWRQDASVAKFNVLNVMETAMFASDVGVSVSTYTNKGTDKLKGSFGYTTNSFGLQRGEFGISGPLKNNFFFSISGFVNMDPGTFRSNISTFLDKTQVYKAVINKRFRGGEIGLQYKFAYSEAISTKQSPYIYHEDGTVSKIDGFRIGLDSYLEQSGELPVLNPLTGKREVWDAMKDLSSTSHVIDLLGNNKFGNGMVLDYTLRYQYANSGMYNPYLTGINPADPNHDLTPSDLLEGTKRYYYVHNPEAPYVGLVQNGMMIAAPSSVKNTVMARFELSKKTEKHNWMIGVHNWYYNVDKANMATYSYQFEVAPNPRALGYDQIVWNKDDKNQPIPGTGKWVMANDKFGTRSHNAAMQYYNGVDNKLAFVAREKWDITNRFSIEGGMRLEWHKLNGDWYTAENRKDKTMWVSGSTTKVEKDRFNKTFTGTFIYKAFNRAGILGEAYYIEQTNKLSAYAGADDPGDKTSVIPGFAAGIYFNHEKISIVSKFTKIKRTNFINNSTFNKVINGETKTEKQTIVYDVNTLGWTTDAIVKPFKGFELHLLVTLQNPKYENYAFEVFGEKFDNSGNVARSVSKTLLEIDPSYTLGKFRIWGSARYFSKEYANYPNTLVFAERWETFAGINFKYDKNVDFSVSVVNLLNQSGAQGSISGTNTTTKEEAKKLYDKPLVGTYIRPFTIEFKTKIRF